MAGRQCKGKIDLTSQTTIYAYRKELIQLKLTSELELSKQTPIQNGHDYHR